MAQIVILISTLMFADLREPQQVGSPASSISEIVGRYGGNLEFTSATPNPDQENTLFLTISLTEHADECAEELHALDEVLAAYVKPGNFLP